MKVSIVPREFVSKLTRAYKALLKVEEYLLPRADALDIFLMCVEGQAVMWGVFDDDDSDDFDPNERLVAVAVTTIAEYPKLKLLQIVALGAIDGNGSADWLDDLYATLKRYQVDSGCKGIEEIGRDGWIRKLPKYGFQKSYVVITDLTEYVEGRQQTADTNDLNGNAD